MARLRRRSVLLRVDGGAEEDAHRRQATQDAGLDHVGHVLAESAFVDEAADLLRQAHTDVHVGARSGYPGEEVRRHPGHGVVDGASLGRYPQEPVGELEPVDRVVDVHVGALGEHLPVAPLRHGARLLVVGIDNDRVDHVGRDEDVLLAFGYHVGDAGQHLAAVLYRCFRRLHVLGDGRRVELVDVALRVGVGGVEDRVLDLGQAVAEHVALGGGEALSLALDDGRAVVHPGIEQGAHTCLADDGVLSPDLRLEQESHHTLRHAVYLHLASLGQLEERLDRLQVAADPEGHQAGHTQLLERPGHLASRALGPDGYPGQAFGVAGAVEAVADSPEVDLAARVGGHPVGEAAGAVGDHLHGVARAHEPGVVEPLRNVVEVMLGPGGPPSYQVEQDLGSRDDIHATSSKGLLLKYFITDIIPLYASRSLVPEARSHQQEGGSPFAKMNGAPRVGRAL